MTSKFLTSHQRRGQDGMMQHIRMRIAIEMRLFTSGKVSSSSPVLVLKVPSIRKGSNANQSSDGPLRYANDIRSQTRTNIGIKDKSKNIKNKFTPTGCTLKCIRPNTEFNFYGKRTKITFQFAVRNKTKN